MPHRLFRLRFVLPLLSLLLAAFLPARAVPPQTVPDAAPLQPAELAEAVPLLQQSYCNALLLTGVHTGDELAALLPSLHGVGPVGLTTDTAPIRSELLPGRIGYWRIGALYAKDWKALGAELSAWNKGKAIGVILDLRHCRPAEDACAEAARVASFFVPDGTVLFSVQALQFPQRVYRTAAPSGKPQPPVALPLVVLTDRATDGVAEVLAEVLRRQAGAVVVGQTTPGDGALLTCPKLSTGRALRLPVAPALLPDGTSLLGTPVVPDIALFVDDRTGDEALAQIRLGPAARGLVELPLRRRMNEASLVHEENPEIGEMLQEQEQARLGKKEDAPPLQDVTLMRAVDVVKGIALFPAP